MIRVRFKPAAWIIPLCLALWGAIGMGAAVTLDALNHLIGGA